MTLYSFMQWLWDKNDKINNQELDDYNSGYLQALNDVEYQLEKNKLIYQDGGQL